MRQISQLLTILQKKSIYRNLTICLGFSFFILSISSCEDEPREKRIITYKYGQVWPMTLGEGPTTVTPNNSDPCPTLGKNCGKPGGGTYVPSASSTTYQTFKQYYLANNINGYIDNHRGDWYVIFPDIRYDQTIEDRIRAGVYKIYVAPNDRAIYIYGGNRLTDASIVLVYIL